MVVWIKSWLSDSVLVNMGRHRALVGCSTRSEKSKGLSFLRVQRLNDAAWKAALTASVRRIDPGFNDQDAFVCSRYFEDLFFKEVISVIITSIFSHFTVSCQSTADIGNTVNPLPYWKRFPSIFFRIPNVIIQFGLLIPPHLSLVPWRFYQSNTGNFPNSNVYQLTHLNY